MRGTKKIIFGLGIASGALLATLLVKSDLGQKTKNYIVRRVRTAKENASQEQKKLDDSEINYDV